MTAYFGCSGLGGSILNPYTIDPTTGKILIKVGEGGGVESINNEGFGVNLVNNLDPSNPLVRSLVGGNGIAITNADSEVLISENINYSLTDPINGNTDIYGLTQNSTTGSSLIIGNSPNTFEFIDETNLNILQGGTSGWSIKSGPISNNTSVFVVENDLISFTSSNSLESSTILINPTSIGMTTLNDIIIQNNNLDTTLTDNKIIIENTPNITTGGSTNGSIVFTNQDLLISETLQTNSSEYSNLYQTYNYTALNCYTNLQSTFVGLRPNSLILGTVGAGTNLIFQSLLPTTFTSNILYYDPTSGIVRYGTPSNVESVNLVGGGPWFFQSGGSGNLNFRSLISDGSVNITPTTNNIEITTNNGTLINNQVLDTVVGGNNINKISNAAETGSIAINSTGDITMIGTASLKLPTTLNNVVTSNSLYYNNSTGLITYGANVSTITAGTNITLTGTATNPIINTPTNPNSTLINNQILDTIIGGNNINKISNAAETGSIAIDSTGNITMIGTASLKLPTTLTNTVTSNALYYNNSTGLITYGAAVSSITAGTNITLTGTATNPIINTPTNPNSTLINYQVADTSTGSGNIISKIGGGNETYTVICNNSSIELKGIPNSFPVNNKNLLYYDNVTGIISYDTVANNTNILYQVADTSIHGPGNIITNIGSGTEGAVILCSDSPSTIELFAPNINFLGNSTFTISTLNNVVTSNALYYNNVTGAVTYGALPTNPNSTLINNQILDTVIGGNNITKIQNAGETGSIAIDSAGDITMIGTSSFKIPTTLSNVVTANALYYNNSSGLITYGAIPNSTAIKYQQADTATPPGNIIVKIGSQDETAYIACSTNVLNFSATTYTFNGLPTATATDMILYNVGTTTLSHYPPPSSTAFSVFLSANFTPSSGNIILPDVGLWTVDTYGYNNGGIINLSSGSIIVSTTADYVYGCSVLYSNSLDTSALPDTLNIFLWDATNSAFVGENQFVCTTSTAQNYQINGHARLIASNLYQFRFAYTQTTGTKTISSGNSGTRAWLMRLSLN